MKISIFLLLLLVSSIFSYSQAIRSNDINNKALVQMIGSIETLEHFRGRHLNTEIFRISNGSGSAHLPESDEISNNFLISVAEYDEEPNVKLYSVGPFLFPQLIKIVDSGERVTLFIEHGAAGRKKTTKVLVGLTKIRVNY